ncbi:MAG: 16S rRNA (uracil(1498)-N(3))-methyltransferase [Ruminococcaceae bacterium]|nr:16S rRNA (uracil(1498)-N(3))-methyltransferase [Oscillospiraceae bacterium]
MQRFFVTADAIVGDTVRIVGEDAHHISYSLRMRKGDALSVCCPECRLLTCVLDEFGEGYVLAKIQTESVCKTEPPYRVRLYQALPKGDKLETIVQKAVECGVYSVTPFESSRCIAKPGHDPEKKRERLNRIAAEAAKQCGRGMLPEVRPTLTYRQMLAEASQADLPLFCYEAEGTEPLGVLLTRKGTEITIVIGAEGGFSSEEAEEAKRQGMLLCGLGPRILRCETASGFVLAALSLCRELTPDNQQ